MDAALEGVRIGFLGTGAMAKALAGGLVASGVSPEQLAGADPDGERRRAFAAATGAAVVQDNGQVVARSDLVVLAVKPDIVANVLDGVAGKTELDPGRPIWVSIAAGIPLAQLQGRLPPGTGVIRAMPNTPALVGAGATAIVANPNVDASGWAAARALFESVGLVWEAPSEDLIDAVTGLSGSGPAYVLVFVEALEEAGARMGMPREMARSLALQTVLGTVRLVLETGREPASLRREVTSPGGTTIAGLEQLEALGLRPAVEAAVEAATRRSRELAKRP